MYIAMKLLGYLVFYLFPAILSTIFMVWVTSMPNTYAWIYKCSSGDVLCNVIVYSIIFVIAYIIFSIIVGIIWEFLVYTFPKTIGVFSANLSNSNNTNLGGVNSLWAIAKEKKVGIIKLSVDVHKTSNWENDNILFLCIHNDSFFHDIKNI